MCTMHVYMLYTAVKKLLKTLKRTTRMFPQEFHKGFWNGGFRLMIKIRSVVHIRVDRVRSAMLLLHYFG